MMTRPTIFRPCAVTSGDDSRRGQSAPIVVVLLILVAVVGLFLFKPAEDENVLAGTQALTAIVEQGPFHHEIVERGEVESPNAVEIRCEVKSRSSGGTTILEIVPEGSYVEKGDFLARLDDSALQTELLQQQIVCNNSEAQVIQSRSELEAAKLALEEYEAGMFDQEEEQLESAELIAKENLRRAQEYLQYSERLAERGYVSDVQLEADRFAVEKAQKELDVARKKLEVLRKYTRQKMINQLQADIDTAEANLKSRENSYQLELQQLKDIEQQLANCVIRAPSTGQVVYAKHSRTQEVVVGEGMSVRELQVMFQLPDPRNMSVLAKVHESRIDYIKPGMQAVIRLDAFSDVSMTGTVRKVGEYPLPPANSYVAHVKEYAVEVDIDDPTGEVRPGMNAEVAFQIEHQDEALLVPVQAVIEREGRHYCMLPGEDRDNAVSVREVAIGSTNEKFVKVEQGLTEGETVIVNPETFVD
ncbi:MAG: efflux RND transporter periplasmic adaptor subunit, partial [Maioricimonas sp. JB045]